MARKHLRILFAAGAALWLAAPAGTAHAQGKIGVVQIERIVRDSAPALRAQKKLEAEFSKREAELAKVADQLKRMQDELEKDGVTMSEAQRRNEELSQVVEQANRIIRQSAEQEKYDIIFQEAAYANPRIDITDKVIKSMDGKPPAK